MKEMVSLAQILIVAAAVMAPGFAVNPGTGNALTVTNTSFEAMVHNTPLTVLTVSRR